MNVLEFGGGSSTIWFSARSRSVVTVELNLDYLAALKGLQLPNVSFFEFSPAGDSSSNSQFDEQLLGAAQKDRNYLPDQEISAYLSNLERLITVVSQSDLILIDGGPRHLATEITNRWAKDKSIIVLDNTDSADLDGLADVISDERFIRIPFVGMGPLNPYGWETTIYIPTQR